MVTVDSKEEGVQQRQEAVQYLRNCPWMVSSNPNQTQSVERVINPRNYRGGFKPRGGQKFNWRIAVLYKDEEGQTYQQELQGVANLLIDEEQAEDAEEDKEDSEETEEDGRPLTFLDGQEDVPEFTADGFITGAFLGLKTLRTSLQSHLI